MEPQRHIPALDPINNELTKLSLIPEFKTFCPRIWELMDIVRDIYSLLGSKGLTQFDVPIRYIHNFLTRYDQELKHNADIATVMLSEMLDIIHSYLSSLQKMAKEAPERPTAEQPKSSWRPFKNLFSSSGSVASKSSTCTIEQHGLSEVLQKAYSCQTCQLENEKMLCEGCAIRCHSGHKVQLRGEAHGYCDCRYETTLCQLQEACTMNYTGRDLIAQQAFLCETCKMDQTKGEMVCHYCSENCHKGHTMTYLGMTGSGFCDCKDLFKFCHQHKRK